MARSSYSRDDLGNEIAAPWGYYQPLEEGTLEHRGRQVLYTLGSACIEASCCGKGSWNYARVEGYVVDAAGSTPASLEGAAAAGGLVELDTIADVAERAAIAQVLVQRHPGVRVEFR